MTDNFTSNPAAYLSELQRIEREQELAKLRTLRLEFAGVLDFFPKLREELTAFDNTNGIAFDDLSVRLRSTLQQAVDLQFDMMDLPAELRDAPEMQAFVQQVKQAMGLQFVGRCTVQFNGICQDIQTRFSQKAEVERKAREKIDAERKARERAEKERRERDAKIQAAIPEMVVIPAGNFIMGCIEDEWIDKKGFFGTKRKQVSVNRDKIVDQPDWPYYPQEMPIRRVQVDKFLLGKYLVTFAQFDIFCKEIGKRFDGANHHRWDSKQECERYPVLANCYEAEQYIAWLNEVTGKAYRLPSEAEWEYAARGGRYDSAYPWGMKAGYAYANYGKAIHGPTPVGKYPANGFGLYDMHGNVREWCQDRYRPGYQGAPSTGIVWAGGEASHERVLRGGSWADDERGIRSASRWSGDPRHRDTNFCDGFRIALDF